MWPFMVALLPITLCKLKSHAVPQRKSFLALMTGLQLDCTCHAPEGWGLYPGSPSSCYLCVHQSHPSELSPLCVHSPFTPSALPTAVFWRITCKCLSSQPAISSVRVETIPVFSVYISLAKLSAWHTTNLSLHLLTFWWGLCLILTLHWVSQSERGKGKKSS